MAGAIGPLYHIAPLGVRRDCLDESQGAVDGCVAFNRWGRCGGGLEHGISWGRAPPLVPDASGREPANYTYAPAPRNKKPRLARPGLLGVGVLGGGCERFYNKSRQGLHFQFNRRFYFPFAEPLCFFSCGKIHNDFTRARRPIITDNARINNFHCFGFLLSWFRAGRHHAAPVVVYATLMLPPQ